MFKIKNELGQFIKGHKHSEETKQKISKALKGKKGYKQTEKHKKNTSIAMKGKRNALGYRHTKKAKQKISKANKDEKNSNYKGGIKISKGYYYILMPHHLTATKQGYVLRSRFVAEKCLSRYLTKKEQIHHINGIKDDDRVENLYLFASNSAHINFHHLKNRPILISNLISLRMCC